MVAPLDTTTRNLLVFGATGGTGLQLVTQALARGHRVTAFVRDPARLDPARLDPGQDRLTVQVGDVLDLDAVRAAIPGHDAVLSCIGAPPSSKAGIRGRGTAVILAAMADTGVRRLVSQSTHGIGASAASLPWVMRWLVVPLYLSRVFADHQVQEAHIQASDLDWTIVKPPHLTDGPRSNQPLDATLDPAADIVMKVSRADVAAFMLDQVDDRRYLRQAPIISRST